MAKKEWLKEGVDGLTFGERLDDLIKRHRISASQLAKSTHIPQSAISAYINGTTNKDTGEQIYRAPDCAAIIALANYFSVSTDYLLGITNIQNRDIAAQGIVEKTGLSPFVVEWLMSTKQDVSYYDLPPLKLNDARHAFACYLLEASIECTADSEIIQAFRHAYRSLTNDSNISFDEESRNDFVTSFEKMEQFGWYSITGEDAGKWFAHRIAERVERKLVDVIERFGHRWEYGEYKAER